MFLTIGQLLFAGQAPLYQIEEQNSRYLIIRLNFPAPELEKTGQDGSPVLVEMPGLLNNFLHGAPLVPVFSRVLVAPDGPISWEILEAQKDFFPGLRPVIYRDPNLEDAPIESPPLPFPARVVSLDEQGLFRDFHVVGLKIFPVQVTAEGLLVYRSLRLRINFALPALNKAPVTLANKDELELVRNFVLNKDQVNLFGTISKKEVVLPEHSSAYVVKGVKFFVRQKGIYRVTGQDLLDANVDISQINPQTLRLTNRGKEVPILISGEQDLTFDPEDYIEFWGEKNEKTFLDKYPDLYVDPFTDENVYWLSWGGKPGIRMVEESGAIVETNPARYNAAPFYRYTLHLEENKFFERFGFGSTHRMSYTRDLWFFDSGVQAIGKKAYKFDLIYPDSASFNPVYVKAVFAGKSYTNKPHKVMVWLNNRLVGSSGNSWFNQDVFTLDNYQNSTIRTLDLAHGENTLEIQMPELPPNVASDYILFNWADITYDRQYRAYHDYIEFRRPSIIYFPNNDLFQFEIEGFTRPDIEVYKKGISKIINYDLTFQGDEKHRLYKITFQDNVRGDDIEYIALTPDLKLKPERIEVEEPFDPEHPQRTLKDPTNAADYLIITHQKFRQRVEELAEYRRSQGLAVTVVNVQDIYDEFNYGIKSPLAIQRFLKYAFYNWDRTHRLKYVVLFGDANYDYKTADVVHEDFVPTFFFQTYKFGAVATDFPYSLIAGDDYIPDVFVGRIPAATNSEVTSYIAKIKEYEQNPAPGPWRNQSLFISGNDANTYELGNIFPKRKKPAFRTQNQRIIDMLLPKTYSSFKLNIVADPNLDYDPNFGSTTDLIEYFDEGVNFMTFLGHGGGAIWADKQLFNLEDVNRLNNKGKYPFIASMTCFTGAFDNPGNPGLAQRLLLAYEKGAIGVFASSGLGWLANDYAMLWNVMRELFVPGTTIGQAVTMGKIDYFVNAEYVINDTIVPGYNWGHSFLKYDMVHQYNLLGDPYLHLIYPEQRVNVEVENPLAQAGDTLSVQVAAPFSSGEGYLELANYKNEVVNRLPITLFGPQQSFQIPLPADFPKGIGYVRVYLANSEESASGVKQIGIDYSIVDSIRVIPPQPNAEDSVSLELVVQSAAGVQKVEVIAILPNDTMHIATEKVGENLYRTTRKIPPTYSLAVINFYVYVTDDSGETHRFMDQSYRVVEDRPDPFIYPGSFRLGGEEQVKFILSVGNHGDVPAEKVPLALYNGYDDFRNNRPFAEQTVNIGPRDSTTLVLDFPFPLNQSNFFIYAALDRQHSNPDFNRFNNLDSARIPVVIFNASQQLGTTYDGVRNATLMLGNQHSLWIPPAALNSSTALTFELQSLLEEKLQPGLTPVPLADGAPLQVVDVWFHNRTVSLTQPMSVQIGYSADWVRRHGVAHRLLKLYRWDVRTQAWLREPAAIDSLRHVLRANVKFDGLFGVFTSADDNPPQIRLTVDGRPLRRKSQVSANPELNIVLEDESGLNILRNQIVLKIDEVEIPRDKVFIPDSVSQSKIIGIKAYPELEEGQHTLTVEARDVNGNYTREEYTLLVSNEFDLHVFGNYPNPFSDFTIFSYYVSPDVLDDLEIRIFTVSGRLIKRIRNDINTINQPFGARSSGYNELIWDGTDDEGNEVANGVYFALIRAKYQGEVKEEILKVAKLR